MQGRDPIASPHFYCDEMLGRLARHLRAAGFDTRLACDGAADSLLLREAAAEQRWLLTLDRRIMEHKLARDHAILLPQGTLDRHAETLGARFALDWLDASFTRCLVDNTPLAEASSEHRQHVPLESRPLAQTAKHCPACGRIYWRGSHFHRMRGQLVRWQARNFKLIRG